MKNIIDDWSDAEARDILRNCRRAVPDVGVLVLIEYRLGDDNTPSLGKMIDLVMLTITGGKERTVAEHRALLASAGFRLNRTIPVSPEITIVEAFPAALANVNYLIATMITSSGLPPLFLDSCFMPRPMNSTSPRFHWVLALPSTFTDIPSLSPSAITT